MTLRGRDLAHEHEHTNVPAHITDWVFSRSSQPIPPYAVEYSDGGFDIYGKGEPQFKILTKSRSDFIRLLMLDPYSLATEFVLGNFSVEGDLVAAVHFYYSQRRSRIQTNLWAALISFSFRRLGYWFQTKAQVAQSIRFHYDQSNDFYRLFLDTRMVYSCAYFKDKQQCLEDAQLRKLQHICRKLDLHPGEKFLDVGCGWGGLITYAAEDYGVLSTGCTLSAEQYNFVSELIAGRVLQQRVRVELSDYGNMIGPFDKIASVGMFEHVGPHQLGSYFQTLNRLLRPGGLILNHGITRPETVRDGPETLFVLQNVFPGGGLRRLSDVIRVADRAGFEVVDVENLRPHYALTCRAWVHRLQENVTQCLRVVDRSVYRAWLLTLAASARCFEDGRLNVNQVLLYKPGDPASRPFTRQYMYEQMV